MVKKSKVKTKKKRKETQKYPHTIKSSLSANMINGELKKVGIYKRYICAHMNMQVPAMCSGPMNAHGYDKET